MLQHRMVGREIELVDDPNTLASRGDAGELDALSGVHFAADEVAQEVEVPPRAPELAVGRKLQPDRRLPLHDLLDLGVLDLAQIGRRDFLFLVLGARILDAVGPEQAAHFVGSEWRLGPGHGLSPFDGRLDRVLAQRHLPAADCYGL